MKLIKSSSQILDQAPGLEGIYNQIELAGRTCYRSSRPEGKTAKDFVDMLIKRGHLSPLEHGTVYLQIPHDGDIVRTKYDKNPYSKVKYHPTGYQTGLICVTTNYRVLVEGDCIDDLEYLCEPTEYHEKRVGVRVNCSIGISREWNRHRTLSVCEQSTRYCNYSNDKFGNKLTFVTPSWIKYIDGTEIIPIDISTKDGDFINALRQCEESYLNMIKRGASPQQAREVLPLSTATEVVYTGFISDWQHFFQMRCSPASHPDMVALAKPLKEEFINRKFL